MSLADLINLNKARKRKARQAQEVEAAANRIRYGRSKANKQADAQTLALAKHKLDGIRREPSPETDA